MRAVDADPPHQILGAVGIAPGEAGLADGLAVHDRDGVAEEAIAALDAEAEIVRAGEERPRRRAPLQEEAMGSSSGTSKPKGIFEEARAVPMRSGGPVRSGPCQRNDRPASTRLTGGPVDGGGLHLERARRASSARRRPAEVGPGDGEAILIERLRPWAGSTLVLDDWRWSTGVGLEEPGEPEGAERRLDHRGGRAPAAGQSSPPASPLSAERGASSSSPALARAPRRRGGAPACAADGRSIDSPRAAAGRGVAPRDEETRQRGLRAQARPARPRPVAPVKGSGGSPPSASSKGRTGVRSTFCAVVQALMTLT